MQRKYIYDEAFFPRSDASVSQWNSLECRQLPLNSSELPSNPLGIRAAMDITLELGYLYTSTYRIYSINKSENTKISKYWMVNIQKYKVGGLHSSQCCTPPPRGETQYPFYGQMVTNWCGKRISFAYISIWNVLLYLNIEKPTGCPREDWGRQPYSGPLCTS